MQGQALSGGETAGFVERLIAYIIDVVILIIPLLIISLLFPFELYVIAAIVIGVAYYVYFWTSSGATPGKMVMGLKVVRADSGELVDPGTAILRYVGYIVSGLVLYLGFLWIIWDPNKEGWHDKIAKTRVIKTK
jgi:uncharacterized RDD family membrane protein YckC